jgi:hypothetical protein
MVWQMIKRNDILPVTMFIIAGLLYLVKIFHIFQISNITIFSVILIIYGITRTYQLFGEGAKGSLFLYSTLFLLGILLFVNSIFILKGISSFILPAILFIAASGFTLLFLEKTSDRKFLYIGLVLFGLSAVFTYSERAALMARGLTSGIYIVQEYWPLLLIICGLILILRRPYGK